MGHMSQRDQRVLVLAFQDYSIGTLAHHSKNVVFVHATPEMSPLTFVRLGGGLRPAHILGCPKHRQILAAPEIQCLWMDLGVTLPQKQVRIIVK